MHLADALREPMNAESWNKAQGVKLSQQIKEKTEELKFLRSADLRELVKRPEFPMKSENGFPAPLEALRRAAAG